MGSEDGCKLVGNYTSRASHPVSSSNSMVVYSTAAGTRIPSDNEIDDYFLDDRGLNINLQLGNEKYASPRKPATALPGPKLDLELSLSTVPTESTVTSVSTGSITLWKNLETAVSGSTVPVVDEESTSSQLNLGNAALWHAPQRGRGNLVANWVPSEGDLVQMVSYLPSTMVNISHDSTGCALGSAQMPHCNTSSKGCQFNGCKKGARGSSGFCISHGGGHRCKKNGCNKGAEGRTALCKGHGGGRRCQYLGCTKSAEGRTDLCIAHGGGRRCSHEDCPRAARGKSRLCIRHGGGKRCQRENCRRSAEGLSGLCISHGGGRRCQYPDCTKGAQGSTMLCKAHGGGKRCTALGCTKGAEGSTPFCKSHGGGKRCSFQGEDCPKSVHGGTLFCVAHGGGKRCAMPECTKSARGRTNYCVRHGGGKRCKFEGCGKSAQGSTDFCKAHGGGKRCTWGHLGSEIGKQAAAPCDRISQGSSGLCVAHSALLQDEQVHGGTLRLTSQDVRTHKMEKMKEVVIVGGWPVGADSNAQDTRGRSFNKYVQTDLSLQFPPHPLMSSGSPAPLQGLISVPEGRVHGGNLMTMVAGSSAFVPCTANWQHVYPSTDRKQSH